MRHMRCRHSPSQQRGKDSQHTARSACFASSPSAKNRWRRGTAARRTPQHQAGRRRRLLLRDAMLSFFDMQKCAPTCRLPRHCRPLPRFVRRGREEEGASAAHVAHPCHSHRGGESKATLITLITLVARLPPLSLASNCSREDPYQKVTGPGGESCAGGETLVQVLNTCQKRPRHVSKAT